MQFNDNFRHFNRKNTHFIDFNNFEREIVQYFFALNDVVPALF